MGLCARKIRRSYTLFVLRLMGVTISTSNGNSPRQGTSILGHPFRVQFVEMHLKASIPRDTATLKRFGYWTERQGFPSGTQGYLDHKYWAREAELVAPMENPRNIAIIIEPKLLLLHMGSLCPNLESLASPLGRGFRRL